MKKSPLEHFFDGQEPEWRVFDKAHELLQSRFVKAPCECGCNEHVFVGWQENGARTYLCPQCQTVRLVKDEREEPPCARG